MEVRYEKSNLFGHSLRVYDFVGLEYQQRIEIKNSVTGEITIIPSMDAFRSLSVHGIELYDCQGSGTFDWAHYVIYGYLYCPVPGTNKVSLFYCGLSDNLSRRTKDHKYTPGPSATKYVADHYGIDIVDVLYFPIGECKKLQKGESGKYYSPEAEAIEKEYIIHMSTLYDLINGTFNLPYISEKNLNKNYEENHKELLGENNNNRREIMNVGTSARVFHNAACESLGYISPKSVKSPEEISTIKSFLT